MRVIGWTGERQTSGGSDPRLISVIPFEWYWAVFTVVAASAQTARNAMQRNLTERIGTFGATNVRFIYGLPFAILFFGVFVWIYGLPPAPGFAFAGWVLVGAATQITATACLLSVMRGRSFSTAVAYSKTEPIHVALFGLAVLGDPLTIGLTAAVLISTAGVMLMSWPRGGAVLEKRSIWIGLASGAAFALSSVCFRGAIKTLDTGFVVAASSTLLASLVLQTVSVVLYMAIRDRETLRALLGVWRPSLAAGFAGAFATQSWFFALALESTTRVRTLGLVEIVFAHFVSARIFREGFTPREILGLVMMVVGVGLVLNA